MSKCKVTVLKRMFNREVVDEYLADDCKGGYGPCDRVRDGQEFVVEKADVMPEGFCAWAWADIQRDVFAVMFGADISWIKGGNKAIASCTDGLRPVIFKIERMS